MQILGVQIYGTLMEENFYLLYDFCWSAKFTESIKSVYSNPKLSMDPFNIQLCRYVTFNTANVR